MCCSYFLLGLCQFSFHNEFTCRHCVAYAVRRSQLNYSKSNVMKTCVYLWGRLYEEASKSVSRTSVSISRTIQAKEFWFSGQQKTCSVSGFLNFIFYPSHFLLFVDPFAYLQLHVYRFFSIFSRRMLIFSVSSLLSPSSLTFLPLFVFLFVLLLDSSVFILLSKLLLYSSGTVNFTCVTGLGTCRFL